MSKKLPPLSGAGDDNWGTEGVDLVGTDGANAAEVEKEDLVGGGGEVVI
jgi:hypothetical protein